MEIGMLVNNLSISGGYQKLVINLTKELTKLGHIVTVYTLEVNKEKCYPEEINKIQIISLNETINIQATQSDKLGERIRQTLLEQNLLQKRFSIIAKKIKQNTEVIILHDHYMLHCLNKMSTIKKPLTIWMLNNQLDNFSKLDVLFSSMFTQFPIKTLNLKAFIYNFALRILFIPFTLSKFFSFKQGIRKVDEFAVYDRNNQTLVKKMFHKTATVVSAGADTASFQALFRERSFDQLLQIKILSVGVVFPHRRYEDIINATKILLDCGYKPITKIIGSHIYSEEYFLELNKLVEALNLNENVFFYEGIPSNDLQEIYNDSDIFIFVNDGFTWGISVFEAIAAGLPVIITNNIGAADIIKDKNIGWLVNPCSPSEISDAVIEIITNPQKTKKIINNAYNKSIDFISWNAYTLRMNQIIMKTKK
jgi:glycosyltransferase involved in cell wall biosynthesis